MRWVLVLAGCLAGAALSGADGSLLLGIVVGGVIGLAAAFVIQVARSEGDKIVEAFNGKKSTKTKSSAKRLQTDQFTDHALDVLRRAKEAAWQWRHDYLATEHLLIGLLESRTGALRAAMHELFLPDGADVRAEVEPYLDPARGDFSLEAPLKQTPRFRRILDRASRLATERGHRLVDAGHLFAALLEENDGIAARVLRGYTPDFEDARRLILDQLDQGTHSVQPV